ncbi:MAG: sugar transferase [Deltaproteobacteria bacterium]|nr:sugar transferase [Deltaproteobacteria bacterium]
MSPRRKALVTLIKLTDVAIVAACLVGALALTAGKDGGEAGTGVLDIQVTILDMVFVGLYLVAWHFALRMRGLYNSYRLSPASREFRDLGTAVVIATVPLVPLSLSPGGGYVSSAFLVVFPLLAFAGLGIERRVLRAVARQVRSLGRNLRDVIIVGDGGPALEGAARLAQRDGLGYRVIEVLNVRAKLGPAQGNGRGAVNGTPRVSGDTLSELAALLESRPIDEVFLGLPLDGSEPLIRPIIALCEEQGITVRVVAHLAALDWGKASIDTLGEQPVITISSGPPDSLRLVAKRLIDLAGAGAGLLLLAPVMAAIAIAVKLDSGGPIFFVQERVGLNRRRFPAYKFRTMVVGAETLQADLEHLNEAEGPVFKIEQDPRCTRLGRLLRRLSLDELPQLVNVLMGDMSLVGPRPLPVRDVDRIDTRWHRRRFSVKPGITCLWQINSREPKFEEWIRSDMEYIDNWSLTLDLKILAKTIPAVISGQGAH